MTYREYIGPALLTWFKGIRWLWTKRLPARAYSNLSEAEREHFITYKSAWGPLRFLPVYLFDYGAAVILGYGCISLSRAMTLFGKDHWQDTGPSLWGVRGIR